jgi:dsDNA-specific endonuclease/ATPase MutS2
MLENRFQIVFLYINIELKYRRHVSLFYRILTEGEYEEKLHNIFMPYKNNPIPKRGSVMPKIDEILMLLKNNKWHDLKEITEKVEVSIDKLERILSFLSEYDIIQLDLKQKKVKLKPHLFKFLTEIQQLEQVTSITS